MCIHLCQSSICQTTLSFYSEDVQQCCGCVFVDFLIKMSPSPNFPSFILSHSHSPICFISLSLSLSLLCCEVNGQKTTPSGLGLEGGCNVLLDSLQKKIFDQQISLTNFCPIWVNLFCQLDLFLLGFSGRWKIFTRTEPVTFFFTSRQAKMQKMY